MYISISSRFVKVAGCKSSMEKPHPYIHPPVQNNPGHSLRLEGWACFLILRQLNCGRHSGIWCSQRLSLLRVINTHQVIVCRCFLRKCCVRAAIYASALCLFCCCFYPPLLLFASVGASSIKMLLLQRLLSQNSTEIWFVSVMQMLCVTVAVFYSSCAIESEIIFPRCQRGAGELIHSPQKPPGVESANGICIKYILSLL